MLVLIYVFSICAANLSASYFGIWVTPINAFFLIGLELVVRDVLHHRLSKCQMILVVLAAGFLSFLINSESKNIAVASFIAVTTSCFVDYIVYAKVNKAWIVKSNASNVASGLTDSLIFPIVAFGVFVPQVFLLQWAAKVFGGAVWALVFNKCRILMLN